MLRISLSLSLRLGVTCLPAFRRKLSLYFLVHHLFTDRCPVAPPAAIPFNRYPRPTHLKNFRYDRVRAPSDLYYKQIIMYTRFLRDFVSYNRSRSYVVNGCAVRCWCARSSDHVTVVILVQRNRKRKRKTVSYFLRRTRPSVLFLTRQNRNGIVEDRNEIYCTKSISRTRTTCANSHTDRRTNLLRTGVCIVRARIV